MQKLYVIFILCFGTLVAAQSAIEPRSFNTEVQEKRYRSLIGELRCTVCQNEPLESSNAPLAADLRQQVYSQIMEGRSDFEIRQYMRDRYGDFVLYNPPLAGHTLILWVGPVVLLLIGLVTGAVMIHRRRRMLSDQRDQA
ncbi:MAG: cytochrome c-type biogenesis protein [Wenzhouxiangellaceae bacterium]